MKNRLSILIFWIVVVLGVFILKYDTLDEPYHWDTLHYMVAALDMYDNNFRVIHPPMPDLDHRQIPEIASRNNGHPPMHLLPFVLLWKVFGTSLIVSHLYTLLMGLIGLFFTYKLASYVFNKMVGIGAVILLMFNQLFFAQLGTAGDAMPLFALAVLTVYLYLQKRTVLFIIIAAIMVVVKETAAVVLGAIFIHFLFEQWVKKGKLEIKDAKNTWFILVPLIPLVIWTIYFKIVVGFWTVFDGQMMIGQKSLFPLIFTVDFVKYFLFDFTLETVNKYNFIISGFILLSLLNFRKLKAKLIYALFILITVLHVGVFAWGHNLPRYFVPILPFFYILGAHAIYERISKLRYKEYVYFAIIGVLALLFMTNYTGTRDLYGFQLESNLEYLDLIETHKEAANYIETNYPDALVITSFPMTYELTDSRLGYVSQYLQATRSTHKRAEQTLVLHSLQATTPDLLDSFEEGELTFIKRFEKNGKSVELYQLRS